MCFSTHPFLKLYPPLLKLRLQSCTYWIQRSSPQFDDSVTLFGAVMISEDSINVGNCVKYTKEGKVFTQYKCMSTIYVKLNPFTLKSACIIHVSCTQHTCTSDVDVCGVAATTKACMPVGS